MSTKQTTRMLQAFEKQAPVTTFFLGYFSNIETYNSLDFEIDITRFDEEVAVALADVSAGYRGNETKLFTNKRFTAPAFGESFPINAYEALNRVAGDDPFQDPNFQASLVKQSMTGFREMSKKITRANELQASEVLQTGLANFRDENGVVLFALDFKPKATHFPTAGTTWNNSATDDKLGDLEALADVIRDDGLGDATDIVMGYTALDYFLRDATVIQRLDNRRMEIGSITPANVGNGAKFIGRINIGAYVFNIWGYNGRYIHPQTRVKTPFMDPVKVLMTTEGADMRATYGGIPRIAPPDSRVAPYIPGEVSGDSGRFFVNAWLDKTGENMEGGVKMRPAMIPTDIDSYGCLDTGL